MTNKRLPDGKFALVGWVLYQAPVLSAHQALDIVETWAEDYRVRDFTGLNNTSLHVRERLLAYVDNFVE